jgi:hypothetical protein
MPHKLPFEQRLAQEAHRVKERAKSLPHGRERELLSRKARQLETALQPASRLAFEGFRHHLAELVQPLAAALATRARRGFDDTFDRQVIRQGTSRRPRILCALLFGGFRCRDLGPGFLFGLGLFKILDGQLELLDQQPAAFRRLPELLAPCLGQHQLQPFDFQAARRERKTLCHR